MPAKKAVKLPKFERSLTTRLAKIVKDAKQKTTSGALLNVTIDNLSMIISSQGNQYSVQLMNDLVDTIRSLMSVENHVEHYSKENIAIIVHSCNREELQKMAEDIYKSVRDYGTTTSIEPIQLTPVIGAVEFPHVAGNARDAINKAYVALSEAKATMQHVVIYGDAKKHKKESTNQLILANYLQKAFITNKLTFAFQPIISTVTGEVTYYECLLRMLDQYGEMTSVGSLIPIAEKMGFIDDIDNLSLEMGIKVLRSNSHVRLSINLSNATIRNPAWMALAKKTFSDPLLAKRVVIEITETSEYESLQEVANFVRKMQSFGCQVAFDDFGTGYTSFAQLKHIPVDIIKIDGSFVRNMLEDEENRFFVQTLIDFGHNFNVKTVAEYVENQKIADALTHMGVDYMQGNYFSPATAKRSWLE